MTGSTDGGRDNAPPRIVRWQNALLFSGTLGPKPAIRATLMTMAVRADNSRLTFYMSVDELGHRLGVDKRTAERHLAVALTSGWLEQTERGSSRGRASAFRLTFGATENPGGKILDPPGRSATTDSFDGSSGESIGSTTDRIVGSLPTELSDQLLTTTTHKNIRSPEPTATPDGQPPQPLPEHWTPNTAHRRNAAQLDQDADQLADDFRSRMTRQRRRDWDATFGAFIAAVDAGREDDEFWPADHDEHPAELPVTWQRPEWLTARDERAARALAGHPDDGLMARALGDYLTACERLRREPHGEDFPAFLHRSVAALSAGF